MTIQELESDVRLLKGMVAEQAEQIANLFALLEQLHPPGPIVPQSKPAAPPAGEGV